MKSFVQIHPVQGKIIQILSRCSTASFTDLNEEHLQNDWFSFHIKQLKKQGIIEKCKDGSYRLTNDGKTFSLRIDGSKACINPSPRLSALIICEYQQKFVVQKRLIHPFFGYFEFMTICIPNGVNILPFMKNAFLEETGLLVTLSLKGFDHKLDLSEDDVLVDDKYFMILSGVFQEGKLHKHFIDGENLLLTKDELLSNTKTHFDLKNIFQIYESNSPQILEITDRVEGY